ncbi:DUF1049 domain-containing protein [Pseudolactococcus plantarum]|uniref:Lipopolysaccharide assembly protein A domain-containing protein n=1 Tax=Pseudolactococcus plantarum TaxID=1365 RepID=A0A2A5RYI4_9LACT|nr:DUF1049 domain-containing protein [Lactococcus plantarum]PCS06317.1 hypothetical protein RU87_GL001838 [Lactococcus plantarum]
METFKKVVTPKRVIFLIIFILVLIFGFQNMKPATVSLIFISVKIPVLFLILGLYVIGVITGWSIKRSDVKRLVEQANTETKKELDEIKKHVRK